jgi:hypothetical protein
VVDGAFRTSDPQIYAAGTAAKLSRQYGKHVFYEHYNSREASAHVVRAGTLKAIKLSNECLRLRSQLLAC